jgi:hypothetical protein
MDGTVNIERGALTHTARWRVSGNTLIVSFDHDEEAVPLGMFERDPETLARMLLAEVVERRLSRGC